MFVDKETVLYNIRNNSLSSWEFITLQDLVSFELNQDELKELIQNITEFIKRKLEELANLTTKHLIIAAKAEYYSSVAKLAVLQDQLNK